VGQHFELAWDERREPLGAWIVGGRAADALLAQPGG
jgi:hypothetical protein